MEVSLFVGPREGFDVGAHARSADGSAHFGQVRGARGLAYAVEDVARACEAGIRSFLVADLGLLAVLTEMQQHDELPRELVWKISVMMAPSNPASMRLLEQLGATTVNVPSDMTLAQLAEMRAASSLPIDLYVEAPDGARRRRARQRAGRPRRGRRPAVCQVRPAKLARALSIRRASRRRCMCDRTGEGASRGDLARVAAPSRAAARAIGPGRTRARRTTVPAVNGGGSMSRKRIRAIIVGVVAVAVVVGVTGAALAQPARKHAGVTLTLWHNYGTEGNAVATKNLVAAFEKANPDITIKVVSQPADNYFALLQAASIAHTGPDLVRPVDRAVRHQVREVPAQPEAVLLGRGDRARSTARSGWRPTSTPRRACS